MHENKIREFDQFFTENYRYLVGFTKSIDPKHHYEDTLHDCYIRARTRIEDNGYSGSTYLNYFRVALMNFYKSQYRNEKNKILVDIEDEDYYQCIEEQLLIKQEQEDQELIKQSQREYITTMIYEYLDKYYEPKDIFVFKTYYQLRHHHLNYKQLSEACHMSITSVSNKIKIIKKDLKRNIKSYILGGITMDELLIEVGNAINNGASWEQWKQLHKKIWGSDWSGCACKKNKLEDKIKNWYIENKK